MTPDNNSPTSMRPRFLDWPVAILFSIALHVLILYSFFFAPAPLPLPDLIEISVVFEEPETVRSSADRQTVLAEAQAMRREEPKPEKTAAPQAVAGKTSKETAKPDAPSRAERTQTKLSAEQTKAKTKTKTKTKKKISTPTKHARPKPKLEDTHLAVHRRVPYLDRPVKPAAAAEIRAIRAHEPRIVGEDRGQTVVRDDRYRRPAARAVARYKRAANQGYVMATYNLGRALAEGRGVGLDNKKAVEFFHNAAQQGNVPAILRLAEMHLAGLGTLEDRVEAQALYSVAASLGNKDAALAKVMLAAHLDVG